MTEEQPDQSTPAPSHNEPQPAATRRNIPMLLAAAFAVLVLAVVCTLGGYLWGHKDLQDAQRQRDAANTHLTAIRHALAPTRADLDDTKSTLDAANRRLQACQNANLLLLIQVSSRKAPPPRF